MFEKKHKGCRIVFVYTRDGKAAAGKAAIDAGKCGTADWDTCAECADHDIPTGNFFANVGYTSCPDWVVDAAHEEAAEGGQCAPWFGYEDEDGDEDDDDCTPGYWAMECRDDGHLWRADTCASCEDCPPVYDLTAATEGRYTCEPGTNTYYYDEDLDGNTDGEAQFEACDYDDCSGDDEDGHEGGGCATTFSPCGTCGDGHCTVEGCPFRGYECGAPDGECMFNVIDPGHDGHDYFNAGSCRDMLSLIHI